jgi:hypothetical protein
VGIAYGTDFLLGVRFRTDPHEPLRRNMKLARLMRKCARSFTFYPILLVWGLDTGASMSTKFCHIIHFGHNIPSYEISGTEDLNPQHTPSKTVLLGNHSSLSFSRLTLWEQLCPPFICCYVSPELHGRVFGRSRSKISAL